MSDVVLTEIIEDMDLDHDGQVNLEEYIRDILDGEEHDEELLEREKINFKENLDKNSYLRKGLCFFLLHISSMAVGLT